MFKKNNSPNNISDGNESGKNKSRDRSNLPKSDIGTWNTSTSQSDSDMDEFITDLENMAHGKKVKKGPSRNISMDRVNRALEGISEEVIRDGSPDLSVAGRKDISFEKKNGTVLKKDLSNARQGSAHNANEETMSGSNFKKINLGFIPDEGIGQSDPVRRDIPVGSMMPMKEIHPEIHTGKRYRKCSALLITPKMSDTINPYEAAEDQLDIKVLEDSKIPQLFIEFDVLQKNPMNNLYCWIERSRWLRYEEDYDLDLKRFTAPHLSAMSLRGMTGFRNFFKKGEAILNCHSDKYTDILKIICEKITKSGEFSMQEIADVRNALVLKRFHAGDQMKPMSNDLPMFRYDFDRQCFEVNDPSQQITNRKWSIASMSVYEGAQRKLSRTRLNDRLDLNAEAFSVQVGTLESLKQVFSLFIRLDPPIRADGLNEVNCPLRFVYVLFGPKAVEEELLEVGKVFSIMMSIPEFRETGYSAETKEEILDASKTFLQHSVIIPLTKSITSDTLSGTLPILKQYAQFFHSEQNKKTFEEFKKEIYGKNQEVVINATANGMNRRISVNPTAISQGHLTDIDLKSHEEDSSTRIVAESRSVRLKKCCLQIFPPFKHIILDLKGIKQRYISDYKDAFLPENVSTVFIGMIFIYFVVLSPAITFGALFNQLISKKMSVSMCLVSSGFFQLIYTLCSGQPLEVVGITGPVYVVERVLGSLSVSLKIELEVMRFWIGVYVAILGFVFAMFNGVIVIKHFRRSVEEVYNFFVGIIFILSALFNMFKALQYTYTPISSNTTSYIQYDLERFKFARGGTTLFLAFMMLNFTLMLVQIKRGSFFRRQIRNLLGSFNVPLGIILVVAMERIFFQAHLMPTLNVPPSDKINASMWINPPRFAAVATISSQAHLYCFAISLSLFFIIFVEVSTNSISVTKTERKLNKPSMFSINFLCILVIFPLISAFLGWPYVSGAMVRSNSHCIAMAKWSLNNLPGVSPKVIGAAEQRVSGVLVGVLVLLSVFLGSALKYIPMAAMYGMFLYMGVMGVRDLVVTRRLKNLFQRRKHWHQHDFLKDFPTWHIIILVSIQLFFISILILLNVISEFTTHAWTPLIFPFFVGLYAFIRGYILPLWPRLNTHLSKMDKKHPVKLFDGKKPAEQIILIKDNSGVNMVVVPVNPKEDDNDSSNDKESELDKELW